MPRFTRLPRVGVVAFLLAGLSLPAACAARVVPPAGPVAAAPGPAPASSPVGVGPWRIDVLSACEVPPRRDLPRSDARRVGGLSGLAYEPGTATWLAVSDDHQSPRLHRFRLDIGAPECLPELLETIVLTWADEASPSRGARDFEDLARLPDGSLLLVSEALAVEEGGRKVSAPGIHHATSAGLVMRSLPVPARVVPREGAGVRDNAAFESVTVTADGGRMFVAVEQPLVQDDDAATFARGGASRLFEYRPEAGSYALAREFALPIDPVSHPGDLRPAGADIGVVALLALDERTLLMLERSFVHGTRDGARASRNDILLSRVELDLADDVSQVPSLRGTFVRPVVKRRLLSLADLAGQLPPWLATLDNFEGMAFGPLLPDGAATLVLVSDDNNNRAQHTAFVVLRLR